VKILGIDPGTRNCGYAIVEKNGNSVKLDRSRVNKNKN
jgi:crossover junction endodeoxyribonuclease RuvC